MNHGYINSLPSNHKFSSHKRLKKKAIDTVMNRSAKSRIIACSSLPPYSYPKGKKKSLNLSNACLMLFFPTFSNTLKIPGLWWSTMEWNWPWSAGTRRLNQNGDPEKDSFSRYTHTKIYIIIKGKNIYNGHWDNGPVQNVLHPSLKPVIKTSRRWKEEDL